MLNKHQATGSSAPPKNTHRLTGMPFETDSKYITKINTQLTQTKNTIAPTVLSAQCT